VVFPKNVFRASFFSPPPCRSSAGKVFLERRKQVSDHRDAPRPAEQPLPGQPAHVGHVRVVDREAEDPGRGPGK